MNDLTHPGSTANPNTPGSTTDGGTPGPAEFMDAAFFGIKRAFDLKANSNLHEAMSEQLRASMLKAVEQDVSNMLRHLLIDTENDHNTRATPARVARMLVNEVYAGRYDPPPVVTAFPNHQKIGDFYIIGPVSIKSTCSHHLVPIEGRVWVGLLPKPEGILGGLSKIPRMADWIFRRPQIQEEATQQLADLIYKELDPAGLAMIVKARHMCMSHRGVKDPESEHTTSHMSKAFKDDAALRSEFLTLISL